MSPRAVPMSGVVEDATAFLSQPVTIAGFPVPGWALAAGGVFLLFMLGGRRRR